jgi:predicted nucleotidyltransferase/DNA-binding HxlR family transcriptional regulator
MVIAYIMNMLAQILSSKVRAELFRILFGLSDQPLHMRELARRSGFAIGTIQTELKKLATLDLVERRRDGNRVYYRANQNHPLYRDVQQLVLKTAGLLDMLKQAIDGQEGIDAAFVFGSAANGKISAESDVDLMVIGDIGLRAVLSLLSGVTERIGREINPMVMSVPEWNKRVAAKEHFIASVLRGPKQFITGNSGVLAAMG